MGRAVLDERTFHVPQPQVRDHRATPLSHAVGFSPHDVVSLVQSRLGQHLGHEQNPLASQPTKHYIDRIHFYDSSSTIAPFGQT